MTMTKKHVRLLAIGMLLSSSHFILDRFINIPDFGTGVLLGGGIALMLKSLYLSSKHKASDC